MKFKFTTTPLSFDTQKRKGIQNVTTECVSRGMLALFVLLAVFWRGISSKWWKQKSFKDSALSQFCKSPRCCTLEGFQRFLHSFFCILSFCFFALGCSYFFIVFAFIFEMLLVRVIISWLRIDVLLISFVILH